MSSDVLWDCPSIPRLSLLQEDDNEHPSLSETHDKLLAIEKQIASFEVQLNGKRNRETFFLSIQPFV